MNNRPNQILLGITGSIAAYKSIELIRLLKESGADVRVILTAAAKEFVTPLTLQAISNNPVFEELLDAESEATMSHISLARWADCILIAPATAHFIAKLAHGLADDLLTTACLATTAPIMIAPAMNVMMWSNAATQENRAYLAKRHIQIIGPDVGIQACGETGEGRMIEPDVIASQVLLFLGKAQRLAGKKILISAGPTQEAIDPVRYLSNHSSGKMGYAIAKMLAQEGAEVTLISGPTELATPNNVQRIDVISAQQMFDAVMYHVLRNDMFISTAAVSDYCVANISQSKLKKSQQTMQLELERTPDILSAVGQLKQRPFVIGFAAETENVVDNAKHKLREKKCDLMIANEVGEKKGFKSDYNELKLISANNEIRTFPYALKEQLAQQLVEVIIKDFFEKGETASRFEKI